MLRHLEVDAEVALTAPDVGHVDGEDERGVSVRDGLLDRRFRLRARTPDVDLEPTVTLRELLRSARRSGREAHDRAGCRSCSCGRLLAVGMRHALHRERSDHDRQGDLRTQHGGGGGDLADVDEHPRSQLPPLEGGDVVAQRHLVAGAARVVRVRVGVELLLREPLVVPDVDRLHGPSLTRYKDETRLRWPQTGFRCRGYEGGAGKLIFALG